MENHNSSSVIRFFKNWALPISMIVGAVSYFIYTGFSALDNTHQAVSKFISWIQPLLIFAMLFLTFCKIRPQDLKLTPWHLWLLLFQVGLFVLLAFIIHLLPWSDWSVVIEGGMLCLICPTATAAAVVTQKLGGNAGTLTTYTILINLATAVTVPIVVPMIHPHAGMDFTSSFLLILGKVFPLLFCPFLLAMLLRQISPRLVGCFLKVKDLAFYLWTVALALAIGITVKSIVHSTSPVACQLGIAVSSLIACTIQFLFGRWAGAKYGDTISAAQSCGQKNTVFAIWMGYTFLSPVTSIAGGFYSIWHNMYNSYQLYQKRKKEQ